MKKRETYKDNGYGDYFIEYLPEDVYRNLNSDEMESVKLFHRYSRFRRTQEKGIEKINKKLEPLLKELKERKEKLKYHKKMETKYFNRVSYLKENFIPSITIYEKNESSKSYKSEKYFPYKRKSYKGKSLKKRIVLYSQIRLPHHTDYKYIQKNIYLGSYEKVKEVIGEILDEDLTRVGQRVLFNKIQKVLLPYIQTHSKDGFDVFVSDEHSFHSVIIPWCRENKNIY